MFDLLNLTNNCRACLNYISEDDSVSVVVIEESSAKSYQDLLHEWYSQGNDNSIDEHLPKRLCLSCAQRIDSILQYQTETVSNLRLLFAIIEAKTTGKCALLEKLLRSEKSRQTLLRLGIMELNDLMDESLKVKSLLNSDLDKNVPQPLNELYPETTEYVTAEDEQSTELIIKIEIGEETVLSEDTALTPTKKRKRIEAIRKRPCLLEGCEPVITGQATQHVKEKHRTYCKICGLVFNSYYNAMSHAAVHKPNDLLLSCDVCSKSFHRDQDLKNHLLTVHGQVNAKYVCAFCEQEFQTKNGLKKHREMHLHSPCHLCGSTEAFKDYKQLVNHFRKKHDKQMYKCRQCSTSFLGRREFEMHEKKHRDGSQIHCVEFAIRQWSDVNRCASCEKTFYNGEYLKLHTDSVHKLGETNNFTDSDQERKFKCNICSALFRLNSSLRNHTRRVHCTERVVCEKCGASFKTSSEAKAHMRFRHEQNSRYKCEFCDKRCSTSSVLATHRRTHTNERPYQCPYEGCPKTYKTNGALIKHVRANHTNERPYKCHYDSCEKSYICSQHLKNHLHWHTQEKPFKCFYCEIYFSTAHNRNKHCKVHHPGQPVDKE
ncbi:zinc finger protein 888-like [Malaya genurostris]|uniref:zinc finger protein 888-like n=1 Tax=Malaya genurostris TaxID=325434 RepID=UPI0026F3AFEB|nr:zinc finger protein 888-like [Malaya genurostris]